MAMTHPTRYGRPGAQSFSNLSSLRMTRTCSTIPPLPSGLLKLWVCLWCIPPGNFTNTRLLLGCDRVPVGFRLTQRTHVASSTVLGGKGRQLEHLTATAVLTADDSDLTEINWWNSQFMDDDDDDDDDDCNDDCNDDCHDDPQYFDG